MAALVNLDINRAWYDKKRPVLTNFALTLNAGETMTIMGPSGVGKTTILSIIAGLHKGYEGRVLVGGSVGLIPQKACLPPFCTVFDNITLLARAKGQKPDRAAVLSLLDELGLSGMEGRYPATLSGGQYRRIALGQALYAQPDILLMDEPFSALDAGTKADIIALLLRMTRARRTAIVFVTHDRAEAELVGGDVKVL